MNESEKQRPQRGSSAKRPGDESGGKAAKQQRTEPNEDDTEEEGDDGMKSTKSGEGQ